MYDKVKQVYSALADENSKRFFMQRLNYNLTKNIEDLNKIFEEHMPIIADKEKIVTNRVNGHEEHKNLLDIQGDWVIYGTGNLGRVVYRLFEFNKWDNLICCDKSYNEKNKFFDCDIISPKTLIEEYKNRNILITSTRFYDEIRGFLLGNGIRETNIYTCNPFVKYGQMYFDDMVEFDKDEIFIDAGVYDAKNSLDFVKICPNYKAVYLFEPDHNNYIISKANLEKNKVDNAHIFNLGLWSERKILNFTGEKGAGSSISEEGATEIEVTSLDLELQDIDVTFIKMDIEGAELKALEGAKNIIKNKKPKLAISIYHKDEDILDIPAYILSLVKNYKFYIRVYGAGIFEWVLYAIPTN